MAVKKPSLESRTVAAVSKCSYPEPYFSQVMPRARRRLGDAFGLTKIGINHSTLQPGKVSSMCHWHTGEDEFLYMLEGEVVLRTSTGEQLLTAGMCVGFPAGVAEGHQLINRSAHPAVYLEISNRDAEDTVYYTDPDVDLIASPPHARGKMTRKDGTPY
jgi:uncharacterized cupin superfamily protein